MKNFIINVSIPLLVGAIAYLISIPSQFSAVESNIQKQEAIMQRIEKKLDRIEDILASRK